MNLDALGPRICILGPSNSGKSTLAQAITRSRGLPSVHLDQLHHLPNTNWQPRPTDEFVRLHDEAIMGSHWVMDGNYSRCLPQRLDRATGVIRLDLPTVASLLRYFRRCWFERDRRGALEGGRDSVKWEMIYHIAVTTRVNRARNQKIFEEVRLPKIELPTARELAGFYRLAGLHR